MYLIGIYSVRHLKSRFKWLKWVCVAMFHNVKRWGNMDNSHLRVSSWECPSVRQHLPWVSCERNSSYSFLPIFLKLCTCFCPGLEMCTWFGYNPWINFYHFFHFVNFVIFRPQCVDSGYIVSATPHTILYRYLWNFAHVFALIWRCAHGLDIILELIFITFSTLWTL